MKIDEILNTTIKSSQQRAIINIRYTSNYLNQKQNAFMAEYSLSMAQFNILRILRGANEPLSVNTVKERMLEKSPNSTRLIDKLIEKKLVERFRCDADKRILYIRITQNGLDLLTEIDEKLQGNPLFHSGLSDDEAEQLSNLLDKLRS